MTRAEVRIMAAEQDVWGTATNRVAGVFLTLPLLPTPRPRAYQPYALAGRPPALAPQPTQGGMCYNCYQLGDEAACPYAPTTSIGGPLAGGGAEKQWEDKMPEVREEADTQSSHRGLAPLPALPPTPPRPPLQPRSNLPST